MDTPGQTPAQGRSVRRWAGLPRRLHRRQVGASSPSGLFMHTRGVVLMAVTEVKGKILYKNITPTRFAVTYQCQCGGTVEFRVEEKQRCRGCDTLYQLRVMVGKVTRV